MEADTRELLALTRRHLKAGQSHLRTLSRLCAQLEERLADDVDLTDNAQPKEAQRHGRNEENRND